MSSPSLETGIKDALEYFYAERKQEMNPDILNKLEALKIKTVRNLLNCSDADLFKVQCPAMIVVAIRKLRSTLPDYVPEPNVSDRSVKRRNTMVTVAVSTNSSNTTSYALVAPAVLRTGKKTWKKPPPRGEEFELTKADCWSAVRLYYNLEQEMRQQAAASSANPAGRAAMYLDVGITSVKKIWAQYQKSETVTEPGRGNFINHRIEIKRTVGLKSAVRQLLMDHNASGQTLSIRTLLKTLKEQGHIGEGVKYESFRRYLVSEGFKCVHSRRGPLGVAERTKVNVMRQDYVRGLGTNQALDETERKIEVFVDESHINEFTDVQDLETGKIKGIGRRVNFCAAMTNCGVLEESIWVFSAATTTTSLPSTLFDAGTPPDNNNNNNSNGASFLAPTPTPSQSSQPPEIPSSSSTTTTTTAAAIAAALAEKTKQLGRNTNIVNTLNETTFASYFEGTALQFGGRFVGVIAQFEKTFPGRKALFILDRARHHLAYDQVPPESSKKQVLIDFLRSKNVNIPANASKDKLRTTLRDWKIQYGENRLEKLAAQRGHQVLWLPPRHSDWQPMEALWMAVRTDIAKQLSAERTLDQVKTQVEIAIRSNGTGQAATAYIGQCVDVIRKYVDAENRNEARREEIPDIEIEDDDSSVDEDYHQSDDDIEDED